MLEGSKQFLSVDEIRKRIQERVRELGDASVSCRQTTSISLDNEPSGLALDRFNRLRLRLLNANQLLGEVAAIDPRPVGLRNHFVQLMKRCMRRILIWLWRPIQQFDSAVMVSLGEMMSVLEDFQKELRFIAKEVETIQASSGSHQAKSHVQTGRGGNGTKSHSEIGSRTDSLENRVED